MGGLDRVRLHADLTILAKLPCGADLVVIVTVHPGVDHTRVVSEAAMVLDLRGVTRGLKAANLVRL